MLFYVGNGQTLKEGREQKERALQVGANKQLLRELREKAVGLGLNGDWMTALNYFLELEERPKSI